MSNTSVAKMVGSAVIAGALALGCCAFGLLGGEGGCGRALASESAGEETGEAAAESEPSESYIPDSSDLHYKEQTYVHSNPATDDFGVTIPEVVIAEDGTMYQRTPSFPLSAGLVGVTNSNHDYNADASVGAMGDKLGWSDAEVDMKYLDADDKGCASCHDDLGALVVNNVRGTYTHLLLTSGLDTETTVLSCKFCHHASSETANWVHSIHMGGDTQYADCMDCHAIDGGGNLRLWEEIRYDLLSGITDIAAEDVDAQAGYDQDKIIDADQLFNAGWNADPTFESWNIDTLNGHVTPKDDATFDNWELHVYGPGAANETTWKLPDLIDQAQADGAVVTRPMTMECIDNWENGGLIGQVEVTGVTLDWVLDQVGLTDDAKSVSFEEITDGGELEGTDTYSLDLTDDEIDGMYYEGRQVLLVYEINGERLNVSEGYPLMVWRGASPAYLFEKELTGIRVNTDYQAGEEWGAYKAGSRVTTGVVGLKSGQCVQAGEPLTIEGYAFAKARSITNVQFSFDGGQSWLDMPVENADPSKWVWWTLTWIPPEDVETGYVFMVRAIDDQGDISCYEGDEQVLDIPQFLINTKSDLEAFRAEVESR